MGVGGGRVWGAKGVGELEPVAGRRRERDASGGAERDAV